MSSVVNGVVAIQVGYLKALIWYEAVMTSPSFFPRRFVGRNLCIHSFQSIVRTIVIDLSKDTVSL
jgi:hypothetical protein